MIIDYTTNCNNYSVKILNNYAIFTYICPRCGATHSFTRHDVYDRNICCLDNNFEIVETKITILRLLCNSCKTTHAILPSDVVPYCIYTFSCMVQFLVQHFVEKQSVLALCQKLKISFQLIYLFISRFLEFVDSAFFVLRILGYFDVDISNISNLISTIARYSKSNNFSLQYFIHTKWIFLMTKFHNNLSVPICVGVHFESPT